MLKASLCVLFIVGLASASSSGFPWPTLPSGLTSLSDSSTPAWLRVWYDALTPIVDALSIVSNQCGRENKWSDLTTATAPAHERSHRSSGGTLANTRYKEWWYIDAIAPGGLSLSMGFVQSFVATHYYLWVYDPNTGIVNTEFLEDKATDLSVNSSGYLIIKANSSSSSGYIRFEGRPDVGYALKFVGPNISGSLQWVASTPARPQLHSGPVGSTTTSTCYARYEVPALVATGSVRYTDGSATLPFVEGSRGYYEHIWGVFSRYTAWNWVQAKFTNGWATSIMNMRHGEKLNDAQPYAYLWIPSKNSYVFFNSSTVTMTRTGNYSFVSSASGPQGSIVLRSQGLVLRYEFKRVRLDSIPVGDVQYHQYPLRSTATYTDASGVVTELVSESGMAEWDVDAIW